MRKKEMIKTCTEISECSMNDLDFFCMHLSPMKKLVKEKYPNVSDIEAEQIIRTNFDVLNEKELEKVLDG